MCCYVQVCPLVMCDIDDMNIYRDINACDVIWYKIIYYQYTCKLSLRHSSHMIYKMTVVNHVTRMT